MSAMASQITGVSMVCSTVCSGADQRKHQSSASLAFMRGIHRWPMNSPHKGPVTRKMLPFDDITMEIITICFKGNGGSVKSLDDENEKTNIKMRHERCKPLRCHQIILHYTDVTMGAMGCQITSLTIVYSTVYSGADQRKHQSSASLAFVRGIHRRPVNSPHKWPVTRKRFPFDDVIMDSR